MRLRQKNRKQNCWDIHFVNEFPLSRHVMIPSSAETCPYSAFIMQRRRDASIIRPQSSGAEPNFLVMQCGASYSPASPASSRRAGSRVVTSPRSALSCPVCRCQVKGSPAPAGRGRPNHRGHREGVCFKPFKVAKRRHVSNV